MPILFQGHPVALAVARGMLTQIAGLASYLLLTTTAWLADRRHGIGNTRAVSTWHRLKLIEHPLVSFSVGGLRAETYAASAAMERQAV